MSLYLIDTDWIIDSLHGQQITFERFIADLGLQLEAFSAEALRRAADAWRAYANRRGQRIQCSHCGHLFDLGCPACRAPVLWRQHLITDFLIAGHAAAQTDLLITRDRGYYRAYFGSLKLIAPSADPAGGP
jgi:hypothetical protein